MIRAAILGFRSALRHAWRRASYAIRFRTRGIRVDPSSYISRRAIIRTNGGGEVTIGRNCEIHDFAMIMTYGGRVSFGNDCSLNPFAIVYGHGGVRIGNSVRIAAHTVVIPANHNVACRGAALHESGLTTLGINIGDNVWLGAGSRILDGVSIGSNAVVAAGAVVTRTVAPSAIVAGVPARPIATDEH